MKMVMIPVSSGGSYFLLVFFVSFVLVLVFPPFIFLSLSISLCLTLPCICLFPWLFSCSSPSVFLFFVSVRALPVFLFSGLCFWLSLSLGFFCSPLFCPLLSPARGCLCPAFIMPETAPVVVTAGLLNAL